ncbi:MAG TPA: ROK family protein, partial [Paenirhodobacter sp.]
MTALALDIGGTKLMCALVEGDKVLEMRRAVTDRAAGPAAWLRQAADLSAPWSGRYGHLGIAVTGRVDQQGRWSALNRATLDIPQNTPLAEMAASLFGCPARAVNDAQAAAWAEYHFGAGCGQ